MTPFARMCALVVLPLCFTACDGLLRARMSGSKPPQQPEAQPLPPPPPIASGVGGFAPAYRKAGEFNTEAYDRIDDNGWRLVANDPLSTFSVDVDTASYSNLRRFLNAGQRPPEDSVRIEELINYFGYDYPSPSGHHPFSVTTEIAACPWAPDHR